MSKQLMDDIADLERRLETATGTERDLMIMARVDLIGQMSRSIVEHSTEREHEFLTRISHEAGGLMGCSDSNYQTNAMEQEVERDELLHMVRTRYGDAAMANVEHTLMSQEP